MAQIRTRERAVVAAAGILLALQVALCWPSLWQPAVHSGLSGGLSVGGPLLGVVALLAASASRRRRVAPATGWLLLAIGLGLYGGCNAVWSWQALVAGREPAETTALLLYLLAYGPLIAGAWLLSGWPRQRRRRLRCLLDKALVLAAAALALAELAVALPAGPRHAAPATHAALLVVYPLLDLLLMLPLLAGLERGEGTPRAAGWLILSALGLFGADLWLLYATVSGTYVHGGPVELGEMLLYVGALLAAVQDLRQPRTASSEEALPSPTRRFMQVLPFALPMAPIALLLATHPRADSSPFVRFGLAGVAIYGLMVYRHLVWSRDNQRLMEEAQLEIRERALIEQALRRHETLLAAVAETATRLLQPGSWRDRIDAVFAKLGAAAEVSRVYLFERHDGDDGEETVSQRYEWVADGITPEIDNPELQGIPMQAAGFSRWSAAFAAGSAIHGLVRDFGADERAALEPQGIQALVAVPVSVDGTWWGFVGFDECRYERDFQWPEISLLMTAAEALGAAIQRQVQAEALAAAQEHLECRITERTVELQRANEALRAEIDIRNLAESARYQSEQALRGSHEQLQRALSDLQSTQQQVIEQERLRALGSMASGIAHDFNNTLAPIVAYSEMLLRVPAALEDAAKARQKLEVIHLSALDAAAIVQRLRDFYRHREELDALAPVELGELAEQAVAMARPRWRDEALAAGITIAVEVAPAGPATVYGNQNELREALVNLVFNAADAIAQRGSGGGPGRIRISARQLGGEVVLEVTDNGAGMSEEVRRRCLEPFYSTKGDHGTGLGLAMVYGIVQRHEGRLEIRSTPGSGTTFGLHFPALGNRSAAPTAQSEGPGDRRRVLLIDDEPTARLAAQVYLESDGHEVLAVGSGAEALAAWAPGQFDLVITDRAMPGMNGDQVALLLRQRDPEVPILMLTGFGSLMQATEEVPPAVDAVLAKPATFATFRAALREYGRAPVAPTPRPPDSAAPRRFQQLGASS
ncbi:MAG: response regulator [Fimbriimonadaceae bacterium]|nr:response regulator [Fimbriimonadaceae bacterium]